MTLTRRDALKVLGATSAIAAAADAEAAPKSNPVPIVTGGGTRLYPTLPDPPWWTTQPLINNSWTVPSDPAAVPFVTYGYSSLGASLSADGATLIKDTRNTPNHGVFTRAYMQWATKPLQGAQVLHGTVSLAIHCVQWHRRIAAVLALQVVVHGASGARVALAVSKDANEFTTGTPARTRAVVNWNLVPIDCDHGDVIAVNVGIYANNQTRTLAQGVGFELYANQGADIAFFDTDALGNTWVEFSAPLSFQP